MNDNDSLIGALAALRPATPQSNLPVLMYKAGQASRNRAVTMWRAAFVCAAVGLGGTWAAVFAVPERLPISKPHVPQLLDPAMDGSNLVTLGRAMVGRSQSPNPQSSAPIAEQRRNEFQEYVRIRDEVLANGLAGLPPTPPPPERMSAAEIAQWVDLFQ